MKTLTASLVVVLYLAAHSAMAATQVVIAGPPGSGQFGYSVTVLPNGNFVVTDPSYDLVSPAVANVGAVYLYNAEGLLLSSLRGSTLNDQVGLDGVTVLSSGHFVVRSLFWDNGAAADAGAVTWGHAETGFLDGVFNIVGPSNSLVGTQASDRVGGSGIATLSNGHYVVRSGSWDQGPVIDAGAITWCNGHTGRGGSVSIINSLYGSTNGDAVGTSGVYALRSGHYVVCSSLWDNGPATDAGAATWCDGYNVTFGPVTTTNSIHGTTAGDGVGSFGVVALPNGHYVIRSPVWNNGLATDAGAATWANGYAGTAGPVSNTNSLVGTTAGDGVGSGGVITLSNSHYVVRSTLWDNGSATDAGAVTWGNGSTGISGAVSAANSLVGSTSSDRVGSQVLALTNGHYVVRSPDWDNGAIVNAGAVTWGNGNTGISGPVTTTNSLHGTTASDMVGSSGMVALKSGNYVVASAAWDNGSTTDAGAATWGNGSKGITGPVTTSNSLVGTSDSDFVGINGVTALANGNYVVRSERWDNGSVIDVGAATWGDGNKGIRGPVTTANSLHGTKAGDGVGLHLSILVNGNYVVGSPLWDNGSVVDAGAATWGNGSTGIRGPVTTTNSLVGSSFEDEVGTAAMTPLRNGHYLIRTSHWDNGPIPDVGAITWADGTSGIIGPISAANSLIGSNTGDRLGTGIEIALNNGEWLIHSENHDKPGYPDAGAITFFDGQTGGHTGFISHLNSFLGTLAGDGANLASDLDAYRKQVIIGQRNANLVTIYRADRLRSLVKTGQAAPGAADIAYGKPGTAAVSPQGGALFDFTLTGAGATKGRNRALFTSHPLSGTELALSTGTPLSPLGGGLPSGSSASALSGQIYQQVGRGIFQATVTGPGITASNNRLLLLDTGAAIQLIHRTGTSIPLLSNASISSFREVLQCDDEDLVTLSYKLKPGPGVTSSSDEGLLFLSHGGIIAPNLTAREGLAAYGGGGTFGPFTGRAAAARGLTVHFTAQFRPASGSAANAVFSTNLSGSSTARLATAGDPIPALGGASISTFTGLTQQGGLALVRATLRGSPPSQNEALLQQPGNIPLTRKGDSIGSQAIARILRFWPIGLDQLVLHVQLTDGSQAVILRENTNGYLTLLRTGTTAPGTGLVAKLLSISAVDVDPTTGHYAILGTLSGAPAASNQGLWTGQTSLGDDSAALRVLRLPRLTLRKGNSYRTDPTVEGTIRSIALKPAADPTGAGGRGLAQAIAPTGDLVLFITTDRNLTEAVLLDR